MSDYRFDSDQDIDAMVARLNDGGPWTWQLRDSDSEGFYLTATNVPGKTKVRIVEEGSGYVLELTMYRDDPDAMPRERLHDIIKEKVLPMVGARNVRSV